MVPVKVSIIVPAFQEEAVIGGCLDSLLRQDIADTADIEVHIVVVANGCRDSTVHRARQRAEAALARGIRLSVLDLADSGKAGALNAGDRATDGQVRIYLDADVTCDRDLVRSLSETLDTSAPRYASGTLTVAPARSWVSRCYSRVWDRLPFVASDVSGCGLYAVNAAGRARWAEFPAIHSDDKFARLQFEPDERLRVGARYYWPVPEGLPNLIRVRRRWCEGNAELSRVFPELEARSTSRRSLRSLARLALSAPFSSIVFTLIYVVSRTLALTAPLAAPPKWRRGR